MNSKVLTTLRRTHLAVGLLRIVRAVLLAPAFSAGALSSGLLWLLVPGFVLRTLTRWASTPGTRLYRVSERGKWAVARRARRLGL